MATTVVPPQSRFGHAPRFAPHRAGPWCDHGLRSYVIVTATIGDVATAAMQPTYLLAAICRGGLGGWTRPGHGKPRCLVQTVRIQGSRGLANLARFAA